jgi:hypothetical protein
VGVNRHARVVLNSRTTRGCAGKLLVATALMFATSTLDLHLFRASATTHWPNAEGP